MTSVASVGPSAAHVIEVGNPEKVFFPDAAITKGALVDYYARVGELLVPYLAGRPVARPLPAPEALTAG